MQRVWRTLSLGLFGAMFVAGLTLLIGVFGLPSIAWAAGIASLSVSIVGLILSILQRQPQRLDMELTKLAVKVESMIDFEMDRRSLNQIFPLPVRLTSMSQENVEIVKMEDDLDEVLDIFKRGEEIRLSKMKLLVVGGKGFGKSSFFVILARELLNRRKKDKEIRIPVLLSNVR
jgi:hypothetical protein